MAKKTPYIAELAHTHDVDVDDMVDRIADLLEEDPDLELLHITRAEASFMVALLTHGGR